MDFFRRIEWLFLNQDSGNYEIWNRRFAPEELGGVERVNKNGKNFLRT